MKYVRGFLMAWGCFCWIPCPSKKWHEEDRTAMVAMLPLVGTGLGAITALVWWLLATLGAAPVLSGAAVTAAYFVMTGFIHLDGFMDVADAVMPRHPEMEVRRRILKDPHTGSFAAISMALMLLIFAASAAALSSCWGVGALVLAATVTTSRCVSAMTVISCKPMSTSQYATGEFDHGSRGKRFAKAVPALVITVLVVAGCLGIALMDPVLGSLQMGAYPVLETALDAVMTDSSVHGAPVTTMVFGWGPAICVAAAVVVCALTAMIIGALDRRSLGGMNGDISGHMITSGEMAGMLTAAILMG